MSEHRKFCHECFEMIFECECARNETEVCEEVREECPICMDALDVTKNFAATECGHKFHLSCLMKNVAHNGFGCPYCRTKMADEPELEDDDESVWTEDSEDAEQFEDSALNGLRWLMMRTEGEEIPEDDVEEEEEAEEEGAEEEDSSLRPSVDFIIQKLSEKRIVMEHAVKALLSQHEEFAEDREFQNMDDRLFGEMRRIISNFRPEQVPTEQVTN